MGAEVMGTPVGGMSYDDARDAARREELYRIMLEYIRRLAEYGKEKGLKEIHIEATPLITEFPHSPEVAVKMMEDLAGTAIPVKLLIDWGHALYEPLLKEQADMGLWLKQCAPYVGSIHLQQTDGLLDRHWDFTKDGIVTPDYIKKATKAAGLDHIVQYLEVVTSFETPDDEVYEGMVRSMDYLHRELEDIKAADYE
jgi:sugar phosphate isomerase/epimerase